jgi:3-hydroxymyristoyl/3-hydroxydecanoyl-(acyl carrier protein) dehydratase
VKASLTLAADAPYFTGHFPGRPILPGVVALALMAEAAARVAGRDDPLHTIPFARLRHAAVPGDRLEVSARKATGGRIRADLTRGETLIANAAFEIGALRPAAASAPETTIVLPPADLPPPEALLPQQPPMRFVTAIAGEMPDGLLCSACLPAACALADGGRAPALAAIEVAAQAAATWEAVLRWRQGGGAAPRMGYLVAVRDVVLFTADVPADANLAVTVRLTAAAPPLTHYAAEVAHGTRRVLRGTIATFLPS